MKTANNIIKTVGQPWKTFFDSSNQKMTLYLDQDLKEGDVENFLHFTHDMVRLLQVKTLFIRDNRMVENPLGLDWKIIETTWEGICMNGGNKIIVNHHNKLPRYVTNTYTNAIKKYGIPINLEIKSESYHTGHTNQNLN